jgi:hypothetical protein
MVQPIGCPIEKIVVGTGSCNACRPSSSDGYYSKEKSQEEILFAGFFLAAGKAL